MLRSKLLLISLVMMLGSSVHVAITGFGFFTNQYVYFRYSEDAGLPYLPDKSTPGCENESRYLRLMDNSTEARRAEVQAKTAELLALLSFLSLGCSLPSVMYMGYLSDKYGRRLAIGLILLGQGLTLIVTALVVLLRLPVLVLIAAHLCNGILGGGLLSLIVQLSVFFADITRIPSGPQLELTLNNKGESQRQKLERHRFILLGVFDSIMLLSAALGASVMGSILELYGFVTSVLGLLAVYLIPVIVIWFIPETQPKPRLGDGSSSANVNEGSEQGVIVQGQTIEVGTEARRRAGGLDENQPDLSVVMEPVEEEQEEKAIVISTLQILRSNNPATALVLVIFFLYAAAVFSEGQFLFLYLMARPFCWTPEGVGLYGGFGSFLLAIASLILTLITAWSMRAAQNKPPNGEEMNTNAVSPFNSNVALLRANEDDHVGEEANLDVDARPTPPPQQIPSSQLSPEMKLSREMLSRYQLLRSRMRMLVYITFGLVMLAVSKIILGSAFKMHEPWCSVVAYVSLVVNLIRAAVVPTLKSFLSSLHQSGTQGRLFALIGAAEFCGLIAGQPGLSGLYAATVGAFPGAPFFLAAAIILVSVVLTLILLKPVISELRVLKRTLAYSPSNSLAVNS